MRQNLKALLISICRILRRWFDLADVVFLAAVASLAYGIARIYEPLAWIVVGLIFIFITIGGKRGVEP